MVASLLTQPQADRHLCLDRIRDEALLVRGMMKSRLVRRRRTRLTTVGDSGIQGDRAHPGAAPLVLRHHSDGLVVVAVYLESLSVRHEEERQHMTARNRGDEGLLRVAVRPMRGRGGHGGG